MKQHITPEEWGVFERGNPKAAKKLRDYYAEWQLEYQQEMYPNQFVTLGFDPIFVWFNIGQMIEFLDEHTNELGMQYNDKDARWFVWYGGNEKHPYTTDYENSSKLCDALWEAVKEVLNNE